MVATIKIDTDIDTDEEARAWLVEHVAAPAEAQAQARDGTSDEPPTFLEILIGFLAAYKTAPRRGDEQPIADRIRSFDGPARSLAGVVARLIVTIRDEALTSYLGARLVDLP